MLYLGCDMESVVWELLLPIKIEKKEHAFKFG